LAPARGMAGDAVGVGVVGVMATMVAGVGATDGAAMVMVAGLLVVAVSSAVADMHAVQLAASTDRAVGFMAERWPAAVAVSTVVVAASMAAVVDTAVADTGNRGGSGAS
jgi:predicted DNA repair protein MutK